MARILNRPMFRRGGSTGGITSNLKKPRQGFAYGDVVKAPNIAEIMAQYVQAPEEPKGLTSSDYLRLAAAGAEIMGAQPTSDGSGFLAALSSAGPALSGAATDIADSMQTRKENYRTNKRAYDASMGQAAVDQATLDYQAQREDYVTKQNNLHEIAMADTQFGRDKELIELTSIEEQKLARLQAELSPYEFKGQYVEARGDVLFQDAAAASEANDYGAYLKAKNEFTGSLYGEKSEAAQDDKSRLLASDTFNELVDSKVSAITNAGLLENPDSAFYNMNPLQLEGAVQDFYFNQVIQDVYFPTYTGSEESKEGFAKGGRVGLARGGDPEFPDATPVGPPFEPGSGPNPDPGSPPIMQASPQDIEMTFTELRRRLPPEVNDGVIKLIMSSEQAMIDFAQLMTPDDIATFNEKYNVDLQYPTQVA